MSWKRTRKKDEMASCEGTMVVALLISCYIFIVPYFVQLVLAQVELMLALR